MEDIMRHFICKMCGRSLSDNTVPKYCYFDRSDQIEEINTKDLEESFGIIPSVGPEFKGDVLWNPLTGDPVSRNVHDRLEDYQRSIMAIVVEKR